MALSDERFAEICEAYADDHEVIGELLAEVERLREERALAAAIARIQDATKSILWLLAMFFVSTTVAAVSLGTIRWPWWGALGASTLAAVFVAWWRMRQEGRHGC